MVSTAYAAIIPILTESFPVKFVRTDQASELRDLIQHSRHRQTDSPAPQGRARTIALTSGKGGVGKSVVAINLAIAMAQAGERVCLLDANLGLGNLDLLAGVRGSWNLSHVMNGQRTLQETVLTGPEGITIIPGASGLTELTDMNPQKRTHLIEQLAQLEQDYDILLIDCGSGIHAAVRQFAQAAETVLLLTSSEITSLADTYAAYKVFHTASLSDVRVVFNRTTPEQAGQAIHNLRSTVRRFLQAELSILGCVPEDDRIPHSVSRRQPFQAEHRESSTGQVFSHLARLLSEQRFAFPPREASPFITRLQSETLSAA